MENFKISVIIPVYNGEKFIARAIETVLAQTYKAHEIIVINDGSRDKTEDVLKSFGEKIRFKTIKNGGVSNARNQGIQMATGDLVAFLDADDVWMPDKLEIQQGFFARYPNVGFCCCNYRVFYAYVQKEVEHFVVLKGRQVTYDAPFSGKDALKLLLALNFVGTASTVIIKKEVLERVGVFNTSYKQAEDFELWLRVAQVTDYVIVSKVHVEKKTHETNLTNNQFEMHSCHKTVLSDFLKANKAFIIEQGLERHFWNAMSDVHYKLADAAYNIGREKESFGFYFKSFYLSRTPKNFFRMLVGVIKKSIRYLSFGLITRRRS